MTAQFQLLCVPFQACQATLGLQAQDFCQQAPSNTARLEEALTLQIPGHQEGSCLMRAWPRATSSTCPHGSRLLSSGGNSYHLLRTYWVPGTLPGAFNIYHN